MDKLDIVKKVCGVVVGAGTGILVREVLSNNTSPKNWHETARVAVGSFVIGSIVAEAAKRWTDQQIDKIATAITEYQESKFETAIED